MWKLLSIVRNSKLGIGGFLSHAGLATLLAGLVISRGFEREAQMMVRDGAPGSGLGYEVSYKDLTGKDQFDRDQKVIFEIKAPTGETKTASPGLYYVREGEGIAAKMWPYVIRGLSHDIYVALFEPQLMVFESPITLKIGETKEEDGIKVTYHKPTLEGTPGMVGAKFGADMSISYSNTDGTTESFRVNPKIERTESGVQQSFEQVGAGFKAIILSQNAADKSVQFQLLFSPPVYPVKLFYKPLVSLVWIGMVAMFLGGLVSAVARRLRQKTGGNASNDAKIVTESQQGAPESTA
jgi:cytochrome c-type biogenesis protein CcmF